MTASPRCSAPSRADSAGYTGDGERSTAEGQAVADALAATGLAGLD
jgi:hypothetical protein